VHFPGIDSVVIEDLIFANRILANEKVLDGAPAGRSPCSSTIASCPGLVARMARFFSVATAVKPATRVS
jgi:hypothetical protein